MGNVTPFGRFPALSGAANAPREDALLPPTTQKWYNADMTLNAIVYMEADGRYTAEIPACPGCASSGRTRDEAIANLHEAASLYFEDEPADLPVHASMERVAI